MYNIYDLVKYIIVAHSLVIKPFKTTQISFTRRNEQKLPDISAE